MVTGESLVGTLPGGWESTTLGEICNRGGGSIQTGPFGSQLHASDYVPKGIPSIMPQNIGDNRVIEEGIARITADDAERLSRYLVRTGDIVNSRRGDVEKRALIREKEDGWLCGTGCLRVRFGAHGEDPSYASYYLGHPDVRAWIVRHAQGATMPNLNTAILASLPFVVPPIAEQHAISHILGTLDDKIELNRRMNETLEETARAIFKSWFVDFDPVCVKAEGRDPGLPEHIADLFPDRFEDSELGEIPAGWSVEPIGEAVRVVGGGTPSTKEPAFWEDGIHCWATPRDLSRLQGPILLDTERKVTDAGLAKISSGLLPVGTVLLSSRAPVGYLAIARLPVSINQGFIAMVCEGSLTNHFVLHWALSNMGEIEGRASGTTYQEISKKNFRPMLTLVPAGGVLAAFEERVSMIYDKLTVNLHQSRTLAAIRDALLPRLISGELRVGEAGRMIEAAVRDPAGR